MNDFHQPSHCPTGSISRRGVLKGAALGAAALAAPALAAGSSSSGKVVTKGRIQQSIVHWCFQKHWDVEQTARIAKQLGLKSVELIAPEFWPILKKHDLVCAIASIDLATAPRGVCVNTAPFVRAGEDVETRVGELVELRAFAADDGLPREGSLSLEWSVEGDSAGFELEDPASPQTSVTFSVAGEYVFELRASDTEHEAASALTIRVSD